ncbi:GNAT family N-acetyltransferase [Candidatus Bathyarchaeota archaeon]|nr:GNAT family N-acetyltransferase [Candidatus Bathyarchaeota archaeon]
MIEFVLFNPNIHKEDYFQLLLKHRRNTVERVKENHQIDIEEKLGIPVQEFVENELKTHIAFKPPENVVYLIYVDDVAAGMGRISKVREDAGEIKQMFNLPQFRGRGYGKMMLEKLMETGRELGFTTFLLDVWKLGDPARHIYASAGFREIERYPENRLPLYLIPYYMFMEKKENPQ